MTPTIHILNMIALLVVLAMLFPSTSCFSLDFANAFWGGSTRGPSVLFARLRGAIRTRGRIEGFLERAHLDGGGLHEGGWGDQERGAWRDEIGKLRLAHHPSFTTILISPLPRIFHKNRARIRFVSRMMHMPSENAIAIQSPTEPKSILLRLNPRQLEPALD
ncbi:hypothetical protein C8J56DRAFT_359310 [Mycena floridula]|nr:hypothetical protein C8J56DRAFT_359310 [Mycena floridula]